MDGLYVYFGYGVPARRLAGVSTSGGWVGEPGPPGVVGPPSEPGTVVLFSTPRWPPDAGPESAIKAVLLAGWLAWGAAVESCGTAQIQTAGARRIPRRRADRPWLNERGRGFGWRCRGRHPRRLRDHQRGTAKRPRELAGAAVHTMPGRPGGRGVSAGRFLRQPTARRRRRTGRPRGPWWDATHVVPDRRPASAVPFAGDHRSRSKAQASKIPHVFETRAPAGLGPRAGSHPRARPPKAARLGKKRTFAEVILRGDLLRRARPDPQVRAVINPPGQGGPSLNGWNRRRVRPRHGG